MNPRALGLITAAAIALIALPLPSAAAAAGGGSSDPAAPLIHHFPLGTLTLSRTTVAAAGRSATTPGRSSATPPQRRPGTAPHRATAHRPGAEQPLHQHRAHGTRSVLFLLCIPVLILVALLSRKAIRRSRRSVAPRAPAIGTRTALLWRAIARRMSGRGLQRLLHVLRHQVVRNIMALSWVQLATFAIPLMTLPYLSRTLAASGFGLVVFSQGFSFLLDAIVQYGFDQYSAREVAAARDDPAAVATAVHRVLSAKSMLVMAATVVAAGSFFVVPRLHEHPDLLALAWAAAVANGLSPGWFFVGIERLRLVAVIQLIVRTASAALTFVLVTGRGDAWVAMALYAGASVLTLALTSALMYRQVAPSRPDVRLGVDALRAAWPLFLTLASFTLYTSMNVVLLGLFASSAEVAVFGAAERILRAMILVFGPLTTAVYPRLVFMLSQGQRERVTRLVKIIHLLAGLVAIAMVLAVEMTAPTIIRVVYGHGYAQAVPVLRIIIILIPVGVANSVGAMQLLLLKHDKLVARIVLRVGLLNIALGTVLAPTLGPQGMAISVVIAEASAAPMALMALRRVASGPLAPSTRAEA